MSTLPGKAPTPPDPWEPTERLLNRNGSGEPRVCGPVPQKVPPASNDSFFPETEPIVPRRLEVSQGAGLVCRGT